jgi:F420H(2)-dependent quinone reductase
LENRVVNAERTAYRLLIWPLHRLAVRLSGGRLGSREAARDGMGTLVLTTIGRRSGERRARPIYYMPDGDNLVLVASNVGHDQDPGWLLNLRASPRATARTPSGERAVRAREAAADERQRLWPELVRRYPRYEHYARRAGRAIPVVILEPDEGSGG